MKMLNELQVVDFQWEVAGGKGSCGEGSKEEQEDYIPRTTCSCQGNDQLIIINKNSQRNQTNKKKSENRSDYQRIHQMTDFRHKTNMRQQKRHQTANKLAHKTDTDMRQQQRHERTAKTSVDSQRH